MIVKPVAKLQINYISTKYPFEIKKHANNI